MNNSGNENNGHATSTGDDTLQKQNVNNLESREIGLAPAADKNALENTQEERKRRATKTKLVTNGFSDSTRFISEEQSVIESLASERLTFSRPLTKIQKEQDEAEKDMEYYTAKINEYQKTLDQLPNLQFPTLGLAIIEDYTKKINEAEREKFNNKERNKFNNKVITVPEESWTLLKQAAENLQGNREKKIATLSERLEGGSQNMPETGQEKSIDLLYRNASKQLIEFEGQYQQNMDELALQELQETFKYNIDLDDLKDDEKKFNKKELKALDKIQNKFKEYAYAREDYLSRGGREHMRLEAHGKAESIRWEAIKESIPKQKWSDATLYLQDLETLEKQHQVVMKQIIDTRKNNEEKYASAKSAIFDDLDSKVKKWYEAELQGLQKKPKAKTQSQIKKEEKDKEKFQTERDAIDAKKAQAERFSRQMEEELKDRRWHLDSNKKFLLKLEQDKVTLQAELDKLPKGKTQEEKKKYNDAAKELKYANNMVEEVAQRVQDQSYIIKILTKELKQAKQEIDQTKDELHANLKKQAKPSKEKWDQLKKDIEQSHKQLEQERKSEVLNMARQDVELLSRIKREIDQQNEAHDKKYKETIENLNNKIEEEINKLLTPENNTKSLQQFVQLNKDLIQMHAQYEVATYRHNQLTDMVNYYTTKEPDLQLQNQQYYGNQLGTNEEQQQAIYPNPLKMMARQQGASNKSQKPLGLAIIPEEAEEHSLNTPKSVPANKEEPAVQTKAPDSQIKSKGPAKNQKIGGQIKPMTLYVQGAPQGIGQEENPNHLPIINAKGDAKSSKQQDVVQNYTKATLDSQKQEKSNALPPINKSRSPWPNNIFLTNDKIRLGNTTDFTDFRGSFKPSGSQVTTKSSTIGIGGKTS